MDEGEAAAAERRAGGTGNRHKRWPRAPQRRGWQGGGAQWVRTGLLDASGDGGVTKEGEQGGSSTCGRQGRARAVWRT